VGQKKGHSPAKIGSLEKNLKEKTATSIKRITFRLTKTKPGEY
jgi:hypothetical protein